MENPRNKNSFPALQNSSSGLHGNSKSYSNFSLMPNKKHIVPMFSERKMYDFHTKIVKNSRGNAVLERLCREEFKIEKIMGSKKRVESLDKQRNFLNFANMGDKHYSSPERSKDFFKRSFIFSSVYREQKKYDRRSLREKLGPVQGIFTTIMKNTPRRITENNHSSLN